MFEVGHIPSQREGVFMSSSLSTVAGIASSKSCRRRYGIFAVQYIKPLRGGTQPHLMRFSNGCYYVVKFQNNSQGKRVLVNELLGARLAEWLGIPVARADIVCVDPALIELSQECRIHLPTRVEPCTAGRCFGSRFPGDPDRVAVCDVVGDRLLRVCKNLSDFLGMLVFDVWTSNADGRQALFFRDAGQARCRAVMIDQGMCFGGVEWKFTDDARHHLCRCGAAYEGATRIDDFEPWLSRLENEIDDEYLRHIAAEVPEEWYDGDTASLGRLLEQLEQRRMLVRGRLVTLAATNPRSFPNWRQGV